MEFKFATREDIGAVLEFIKALAELARIAVDRGCGRLEWWCLDRNKPGIDFYKSMGAVPMDEWTVYRITGERLAELGRRN